MAANMHGEICICLPLRPIIALLSVVAFCVGCWHLISITFQMVLGGGGEWSAATDFQYSDSCQGTACHAAMRDRLLSCTGNRATSFKLRYLVIGIFGIVFGYLGLQGCLTRNQAMVRGFAWYLVSLAIFIIVVCGIDNVYVLACDKLSVNMEKDVVYWIPWETLGLLHAQGHKDFSALSANKLKEILGYDFVPFIFSCYLAVTLVIVYFSLASFRLADVIECGPVGLGPNFMISSDSSREITQMKDRLMNVAAEQMNPVRHHEAFQYLRDGNDFPFVTRAGNSSAITYGSVGVARPLPKESP